MKLRTGNFLMMFDRFPLLCAALILLTYAVAAQNPPPQSTPAQVIEENDVVKITTKLVQIDAVVTDKDSNQITNLTTDDFEVFQDGIKQKITNFSYIDTPEAKISKSGEQRETVSSPSVPDGNAAAGNRIVTFVVDDGNCTASQTGMQSARELLETFVSEQMQPDDLVAIYQTRGGSSLFQQYTSDRQRLLDIVRRIRWLPPLGSCGGGNGSVFEAARSESNLKRSGQGTFENDLDRARRLRAEDFIRDDRTIGGIEILRFVVGNLRQTPGRKIVFFLSDGLSVRGRSGKSSRARDALSDLTEDANRAAVTFHTVDVRGAINISALEARDGIDPIPPPRGAGRGADRVVAERKADFRNSQEGLSALAGETGGRFLQDGNLENQFRRALKAEKGYYLLAYEPESETFKDKKFHKIEIKLKRSGLRAFSRAGFVGQADRENETESSSSDGQIYRAIAAPFPKTDLKLQSRAFFYNTAKDGNLVRLTILLDAGDLIFADEPDGGRKAVIDVVAVAFGENNQAVYDSNRTNTIRVSPQAAASLRENGLSYSVDIPVKEPGIYDFRVAMRDTATGRIGTANQKAEVPDLKNNKLFLSVLTAVAVDANGEPALLQSVKSADLPLKNAAKRSLKIYRFPKNALLAFAYTIYNARFVETTKPPELTVEMRLYRNNQLILQTEPQPAKLEPLTDEKRINGLSTLKLKPETKPGVYLVQIIVKDTVTNEAVWQWIELELLD